MKAIVYHEYGSPSVLRCEDIAKPIAGDDEVLVRVRAVSANPLDWHFLRGEPYVIRAMTGLRRPKSGRLGVDLAGEVEAIGRNVTRFRAGDAVFGTSRGAFAEYVSASEKTLAPIPANVTFEQAAAVPVAARSLSDCRRVLVPAGILVVIGADPAAKGRWIGPLVRPLGASVLSPFVSQRLVMFMASLNRDDLMVLKELIETKKVTPVIDRCYAFSELSSAIRYLEEGHAQGKVVITLLD